MSREFQPVQPKPAPAAAPKRPTLQPAVERKKPKQVVAPHASKDISLVEAGRYGTLNEFAFFDKVRIYAFEKLKKFHFLYFKKMSHLDSVYRFGMRWNNKMFMITFCVAWFSSMMKSFHVANF